MAFEPVNFAKYVDGSGRVFDKSKKTEDAHFIKLPSNLRWYIYVDGFLSQMNYLYALIVDRFNVEQRYAYPSRLDLAREYGTTPKTLGVHLEKLRDVGLIDFHRLDTGNYVYVPFEPLTKAELFERCPQVEQNYKAKIKETDVERARSAESWLRFKGY